MKCVRFITAACLILQVGAAFAKTSILVLPASYAGSKDSLANEIGNYATQLDAQDRLIVYDGAHLQQIGTVAPPTGPNTQNPAWVKREWARHLAPIMAYLDALPTTANDGGPTAAIRPQAILDEIGRNVISSLADKKTDVLLVGSFLYYDPRNLFFSMRNGAYPMDADLKAKETEIPYGISGLEQRLKGVTVHYCGANGQDEFATSEYEHSVQRFWTLWIAGQGGHVGTLSYDLPTCFARLRSGQDSGQIAYQPSHDPRMGMMRYTLLGGSTPPPASEPPTMAAAPQATDGVAPLPKNQSLLPSVPQPHSPFSPKPAVVFRSPVGVPAPAAPAPPSTVQTHTDSPPLPNAGTKTEWMTFQLSHE